MRIATGPEPTSAATPAALDATALHIRALELVLLDLYRDNLIAGTVHTSVGQEYCAACLHPHLDPARDAFVGSHRAHGHYVAWGGDVNALLAEVMGRDGAACGGRGGSQHLRAGQFFSSGIQGGGSLWGTGLAHARTLDGTGGLVVVQLGDGTLGQGAVYEAFTFAALLRAPVLFYLEWNGWAQSTDTSTTTPGDVLTRARGFGLDVHRCADTDPAALHAHLGQVVARVRTGVPALQIVDTRRLLAHSTGDDHRPPTLLESLRRDDPLSRRLAADPALRQRFDDRRRSFADDAAAIGRRPLTALDRAVDRATSRGSRPRGRTSRQAATPLVSTPPRALSEPASAPIVPLDGCAPENVTVREALNTALADGLERDPRVLLIGEDLADPYGGAFKVTRGLSTRFPDRVVSTPVAEAGLVGLGIGLAMAGRRPVVEIMFADFATLAADQLINHAATFRAVYGDDVACPLVVRLVSGGGRGFGPTHSQCLEHLFLGVPGLRVVSLSARHDVGAVMRHLIGAADRPTIVVEHKRTYGLPLRHAPPLDLHRLRPVAGDTPLAPLCFESPHATLTIVSCGGSVDVIDDGLIALFVGHEVTADVVVLTELWPLDVTDIVASVRRTGRLLVVEEGVGDYGLGAAVTAAVVQRLPARARIVGSRPVPVPAARHLEDEVLPSPTRVVAAALELL